jgi:hypothetical protein
MLFMDVPILVAIISATVTILGWLITHILTGYRDRKTKEFSAQMKFTERQLEELYGPLAFLIWDGKRTFEDLLEILGRNYVFPPSGTITEDELNTWLFWLDNYFFPKNERIKNLLMTKTHLIEGAEMPASYLSFLEHHNSWYLNHLRWKKEGIKYSWRSKINAPHEFEEEIIDTFKRLKARHTKALRKISAISPEVISDSVLGTIAYDRTVYVEGLKEEEQEVQSWTGLEVCNNSFLSNNSNFSTASNPCRGTERKEEESEGKM